VCCLDWHFVKGSFEITAVLMSANVFTKTWGPAGREGCGLEGGQEKGGGLGLLCHAAAFSSSCIEPNRREEWEVGSASRESQSGGCLLWRLARCEEFYEASALPMCARLTIKVGGVWGGVHGAWCFSVP
jgi:hypothetical protein